MSIKEVITGVRKPTYIIAEIGVNHNGSKKLAFDLIDQAIKAGADAVKFQTFVSEKLVTSKAAKADYQMKTSCSEESQLEMLKKLELTFSDFAELKAYCIRKKIEFLSTPFDDESVEFLYSIGVNGFKIGSGDMNNIPFLRKIDKYQLPIILSTGMSDIEEVESSVQNIVSSPLALLHCTSEYPAPLNEVNLLAMKTMENKFNKVVGFSDHTEGNEAAISAVALGAKIIEKHFTLDRGLEGPDHRASMEPKEFKGFVNSLRQVEQLLGDGIKRIMPSEQSTKSVARKSIVVARDLKIGSILSETDLVIKRPGTGIEPKKYYNLLGKTVIKEIKADHLLSWDDVR
ncbi:N-acetylneuraminate synthase [Fontibacillus phaseoli]|uniref:N-acetylneuraminate synthase n=1 Tax=Fontibacillus phaseoli TaxID=1416533 RepID=A0A369BC06_9BACL|nr:N-acetylneuraminate synthase [Fontibacillus phaseoli]RCX19070.1 N-acetylneuraminate synthase [Fontibacillus phaseoli]